MRRRILTLCVTILLILSCSLTAFAQEFDPQNNGSISVTLTEQYDKEPIVGAELCVYYIASVRLNANENLNYVYTDTFESAGINIDDPSLAIKLDAYVLEHNA